MAQSKKTTSQSSENGNNISHTRMTTTHTPKDINLIAKTFDIYLTFLKETQKNTSLYMALLSHFDKYITQFDEYISTPDGRINIANFSKKRKDVILSDMEAIAYMLSIEYTWADTNHK